VYPGKYSFPFCFNFNFFSIVKNDEWNKLKSYLYNIYSNDMWSSKIENKIKRCV
jgi:hypothetical protein